MVNEAQLRRTFDLLGRYIGKRYHLKIEFQPNVTPMCDVKNKRIILPSNPKVNNIFPALAELIHEAGHIRHTVFESDKISKTQEEFSILNAVEDIRVDRNNMDLLPNIRGIHGTLMEQCAKKKSLWKPFEIRVLSSEIFRLEGFGHIHHDREAFEFSNKHDLSSIIREMINMLETLQLILTM